MEDKHLFILCFVLGALTIFIFISFIPNRSQPIEENKTEISTAGLEGCMLRCSNKGHYFHNYYGNETDVCLCRTLEGSIIKVD